MGGTISPTLQYRQRIPRIPSILLKRKRKQKQKQKQKPLKTTMLRNPIRKACKINMPGLRHLYSHPAKGENKSFSFLYYFKNTSIFLISHRLNRLSRHQTQSQYDRNFQEKKSIVFNWKIIQIPKKSNPSLLHVYLILTTNLLPPFLIHGVMGSETS